MAENMDLAVLSGILIKRVKKKASKILIELQTKGLTIPDFGNRHTILNLPHFWVVEIIYR